MLRRVTQSDDFLILKCRSCGLQFVDNCRDIDKRQLNAFYSQNYFEADDGGFYDSYWEDEKVHRRLAVFLLRKLRLLLLPHRIGNLSLLDVGCAYGFLLDEARKLGMQTAGIEVSDYARAIAARKFGSAVYKSWEAMSEREERFDIITFLGVLEHLPDPEHHIKLAHHHLKSGGVFICTTLQVDLLFPCTYKPPEHLYYFSSKSLRILFARNGFEFMIKRRFLGFFSLGRFVTLFSNTFHIRNRFLTFLKERFGKIPIRAPSNEVLIVARKS
jgi:2-polyprenyl-3-methyl-5-hydroxy-6-metoxy-1,4-benzoquinol methylase